MDRLDQKGIDAQEIVIEAAQALEKLAVAGNELIGILLVDHVDNVTVEVVVFNETGDRLCHQLDTSVADRESWQYRILVKSMDFFYIAEEFEDLMTENFRNFRPSTLDDFDV